MSSPNNDISDAQALDPQAQSSTEPPVDPELPEQGKHKSAKCTAYPLAKHWTMIAEFYNWDPDKDIKAEVFEKTLGVKLGKDNFYGFWWKKFPPDTQFVFHVPYPAAERLKDMKMLVADAIYEYSGDAKIRTTCYHA